MKLAAALVTVLALAAGGLVQADDQATRAADPAAATATPPVVVPEPAPAPSPTPAPTLDPAANPAPDPAPNPTTNPSLDPAVPARGPVPRPVIKPRRKSVAATVDPETGRLQKSEDEVAGGKHWRIKTEQGAVHVWVPPGYDRATAGVVVYVHGYYVDADQAWKEYGLARQFKASKQNAMFVVPDAPSGNDEEVSWPALTDLRKAITLANIHLPDGPTIVMGHSGAFRTVMKWIDHKAVSEIILLDAMYGGQKQFEDFIASGKRADDHKLIVVAAATAAKSRDFTQQYKFAVAREKFPASLGEFSKRERRAKLLYVHSQYQHMQIVTSGKVIPMLLRMTPLAAL